jgi:hypothetical protein
VGDICRNSESDFSAPLKTKEKPQQESVGAANRRRTQEASGENKH